VTDRLPGTARCRSGALCPGEAAWGNLGIQPAFLELVSSICLRQRLFAAPNCMATVASPKVRNTEPRWMRSGGVDDGTRGWSSDVRPPRDASPTDLKLPDPAEAAPAWDHSQSTHDEPNTLSESWVILTGSRKRGPNPCYLGTINRNERTITTNWLPVVMLLITHHRLRGRAHKLWGPRWKRGQQRRGKLDFLELIPALGVSDESHGGKRISARLTRRTVDQGQF
jgi:hypothetical protein